MSDAPRCSTVVRLVLEVKKEGEEFIRCSRSNAYVETRRTAGDAQTVHDLFVVVPSPLITDPLISPRLLRLCVVEHDHQQITLLRPVLPLYCYHSIIASLSSSTIFNSALCTHLQDLFREPAFIAVSGTRPLRHTWSVVARRQIHMFEQSTVGIIIISRSWRTVLP